MQLVATPDTDCYFWFWPPLCSGTHYSISVSHMSVELVQFMSQLLNFVMFIQTFAYVKFAENKRSWQWEDVSFFAEFIYRPQAPILMGQWTKTRVHLLPLDKEVQLCLTGNYGGVIQAGGVQQQLQSKPKQFILILLKWSVCHRVSLNQIHTPHQPPLILWTLDNLYLHSNFNSCNGIVSVSPSIVQRCFCRKRKPAL